MRKTPFFEENWQKSQKIVIITSPPGQKEPLFLWQFFSRGKSYALCILQQKKVFGSHFGRFFTSASGHSAPNDGWSSGLHLVGPHPLSPKGATFAELCQVSAECKEWHGKEILGIKNFFVSCNQCDRTFWIKKLPKPVQKSEVRPDAEFKITQ
jgi:hypothetical protein